MSIHLLDNTMNGAILAKAFSFPLAFLHTSEICSSKFNSCNTMLPRKDNLLSSSNERVKNLS